MTTTVERLQVDVTANTAQARRELGTLDKQTKTMSQRAGGLARSMGVAFGGAAIVGGITKTINLAKNFDLTVRQIGVQTGKTGKALTGLSDLALKMGQDTVYSAQESADAMLELAKGGLTSAQIRAGALEQALTLAAAGGLDLASAAEAITSGMGAYGIEAKNAERITTALAGGANASTADVSDLTQALSQASAGARDAGMSINETVAALAAFDLAGVKGSDAGTSLKTMMARLVPSTTKAKEAMKKYGLEFVKANGEFVSMTQVARELQDGLGGLGEAERAAALETIFGSDARRAASILMRTGEGGLKKLIRATNDQAKAQEMANTTMDGASGAWENFTGAAETAAIKLGTKFLPLVEDVLNKGSALIANVSTWGPEVDESFGWIIDAGASLKPVLTTTLDLVKTLGGVWSDLPGPVKETATQIGLAALILPRLSAAVSSASASVVGKFTTMSAKARQLGAEMTYAETRAQRLMGAARGLAGAGGMMLLVRSTDMAEGGMKDLAVMGGTIATGFAVAGPWGGALAGAALLVKDLADSLGIGADKTRQFTNQQHDLREALNQTTGAITRQARENVKATFAEQGVLEAGRLLKINQRDLIGASLGQKDAQKAVNRAMSEAEGALRHMAREGKLTDGMFRRMTNAMDQVEMATGASRREYRRAKADIKAWNEALRESGKDAKDAAKKTKDAAEDVNKGLRKTGDVKPSDQFRKGMRGLIQDVLQDVARGARETTKGLEKGPREAKADLRAFRASLGTAISGAKSQASSGGRGVGVALGQGVTAGIGSMVGGAISAAANLVRQAVQAARNEGRIKSPSREMDEKVGQELGRGVEQGLAKRRKAVQERAAELARAAVEAFKAGGRETQRMVRQIRKWAKDALGGKEEDAMLARVKRNNQRLDNLYRQRTAIAKRLTDAQERLASLREAKGSFMDSVRQGIDSQANVLNAGNNAGTIAASLQAQVAKAREFANLLGRLRDMGYSDAIVQQVAAAGIEGGLEAARALAAGNSSEVSQITKAFGEIQAVAKSTATRLGSDMYDAGIKAANGVVDGLKRRQGEVRQTILAIAESMRDAIRRAVGLDVKGGKGGKGGQDGQNRPQAGRIGVRDTFGATQDTRAAGRAATASQVHFQFVTHNPVAEPQSRTINKSLDRAAALGLL